MIKTWSDRCEDHPDHNGIVSEAMIRARMQEEIDELRAAIEQPRQWQGLTDAERGITAAETWGSVLIAPQSYQAFARAIEAKLREKNT